MTDLDSRLDSVLGARTANPLTKAFGLRTVGDLLRHYPRRLIERGELTDLSRLRADEDVTVMARVISAREQGFGKAVRVEAVIGDGTGQLRLVFFGARQRWRLRDLAPGTLGLFSGRVGEFRGQRQLAHPDYKILTTDQPSEPAQPGELDEAGAVTQLATEQADLYAAALIPVYPASKDVRSWVIANSVRHVLGLLDELPDPLPAPVRQRHGLLSLDAALRAMHAPATLPDWFAAKRRLAWDEAFGVQLVLAQRRVAARANPAVPRPPRADGIAAAFEARLPFTLTDGQRELGEQLAGELAQPHPMHRLLQGEVGSGKTIVALRAMLQVIDAGGQAALLAPTEVLAAQHARTLAALLGPLAAAGQLAFDSPGPAAAPADAGPAAPLPEAALATRVALLTGSLSAPARREALLAAASGAAGIVVGTHALIQEHVQFAELGLVVVDEQHRFGVEQRDALRTKAAAPPHVLVMTATPIPRTVAMTVFGDLEVSTLRQLPAGRSAITTTVVPAAERPDWLARVWARISEEVAAGRQAYVVCPRIGDEPTPGASSGVSPDSPAATLDASPADGPAPGGPGGPTPEDPPDPDAPAPTQPGARPPLAVLDVAASLRAGPLSALRVAVLHGRLPAEDKDRVMSDFAAGRLDVLVSTTVIEVGVDVPNATVMAILDAERFGVSQLHQLRGRVGRGSAAGLCLLITDQPADSPARARLDAVAATTDGFELARLDLEQRREGDVLGAAQSGRSSLALLSLVRDEELISAARTEAGELVRADPDLSAHPLLAAQVALLAADDRADYLEKT